MKRTTLSGHEILLLLIFLAATVTAKGASSAGGVWWSPELHLASLADVPSALSEPVSKEGKEVSVQLSNGAQHKTVKNCSEYLKAVDLRMAPSNMLGLDTPFIQRCYALRVLQHVNEAKEDYLGGGWGPDALDRLPPFAIFVEASLSGKVSKARAMGKSWKQYDPALTIIDAKPLTLLFEDKSDRWLLSTVAKGDFNADGLSDELIIACDSKKGGSGGLCFPAVFTAYGSDKVMKLISSPSEPYKLVGAMRH
jgi:hypothetical protein